MGAERSDRIEEPLANEQSHNTAKLGRIARMLFGALSAVYADLDLAKVQGGGEALHNLVRDTLSRALNEEPTEEPQKAFCALKITREMLAEAFEIPRESFAAEPDATMRRIAQELQEGFRIHIRDEMNILLRWAAQRALGPEQMALRLDPSGNLRVQPLLKLLNTIGWRSHGNKIYCPSHALGAGPYWGEPLKESSLEECKTEKGYHVQCQFHRCIMKIFQPAYRMD